ncbi:MAG: 30S ribosomal protein S6 [Planctomycetota bacterium]
MRPYEGMFVVHNKEARKELDYLQEHIQGLVAKSGGRMVSCQKWDDRKLAYEIDRQSHGIYYLTYFEGEQDTVRNLRREVRLSELVLRALFLAIERIPDLRELEAEAQKRPADGEVDASAPAFDVSSAGGAAGEGEDAGEESDEIDTGQERGRSRRSRVDTEGTRDE